MIDRSYLGVNPPKDPMWQEPDKPKPLSEKHGRELIDHMMFFGTTQEEVEALDIGQFFTLWKAGLLR